MYIEDSVSWFPVVVLANIKSEPFTNQLQTEMRNNVKNITGDDKLLVKADKTTNFYKLSISQYRYLTKDYKKAPHDLAKSITTKDITITKSPNLDTRIEVLAHAERTFYYIKRPQT